MIELPEKIPARWTVIAPTRRVKKGLLLTARDSKGFTTEIDQIVLSSRDLNALLKKFPVGLSRPGASLTK